MMPPERLDVALYFRLRDPTNGQRPAAHTYELDLGPSFTPIEGIIVADRLTPSVVRASAEGIARDLMGRLRGSERRRRALDLVRTSVRLGRFPGPDLLREITEAISDASAR